jgi:hypothetical protein
LVETNLVHAVQVKNLSIAVVLYNLEQTKNSNQYS